MKSIIFTIVAGLCLAGTSVADTIYVAQDGSGDYTDIQAAVDAASSGDEILVRPGTYTGSGKWEAVNLNSKQIILRSTDGAESTFISGEDQRRAIACSVTGTVIDGFSLVEGNAKSNGGGAIICSGDVTIRNCRISNNRITSGDEYGGGIYFLGGSPELIDCVIENNITTFGGGIACKGGTPTVTDCVVRDNSVTSQGGGIYMTNDCIAEIQETVVTGNEASFEGGGIYASINSSPGLQDCLIAANRCVGSAGRGGGLFFYNNVPSVISNCDISNNNASQDGGGIASIGTRLTLSSCIVSGNRSDGTDSGDGGGALRIEAGSDSLIEDTDIHSNSAIKGGGGLYIKSSDDVVLRNCSVEDCSVTGNGGDNGGGILFYNCSAVMEGCYVSANSAVNGGGVYVQASSVTATGTTLCANLPNQYYEIDDGDFLPDNSCVIEEVCPNFDTDGDGILDDEDNCYLYNPDQADCNDNGIGDVCDLADGTSQDCNGNSIPDECESLPDCDSDGEPDVCEILGGAIDANPADGIPDECQGLALGACCVQGMCLRTTYDECFGVVGAYAGDGSTCETAGCPTACPGDVNGDNQIGIIDLLTIIDGWGFCP